jgi:uncharacterized protein (TIGR01777 family)
MKILISGSGGLIGSALSSYLSIERHEVFKLVRREPLVENEIRWDIELGAISEEKIEGFDAVIHLAGENIGEGRWTKKKKNKILSSRVDGTRFLSEKLTQLKRPPKVFIVASAVGIYGNRKDEILTEESTAGTGFLADVCMRWEMASELARKSAIKVVNTRFGIILAPEAKIIKMLKSLFKLYLGGIISSGRQYMSWIAIEDLIRAISFILEHPEIEGPVNIVSPYPVTNKEFTESFVKALRRRTMFRIPAIAVRILFGEKGKEMILSSTRAYPKKLMESGFKFDFEKVNSLLMSIFAEDR